MLQYIVAYPILVVHVVFKGSVASALELHGAGLGFWDLGYWRQGFDGVKKRTSQTSKVPPKDPNSFNQRRARSFRIRLSSAHSSCNPRTKTSDPPLPNSKPHLSLARIFCFSSLLHSPYGSRSSFGVWTISARWRRASPHAAELFGSGQLCVCV